MKYLIKPRDVELSFVIALTTLFNVRTCQGAPVVIVPWADCRPNKLEKYPQTIWIICECKLPVDYCGGYLSALLLIVLRIPVRNRSWFGGGTRATFETPLKYPRRPRDQYTAPNSKYIGAECSALPTYRGPPTTTTYPQKSIKIKKIKTFQHGNQPDEVSNNKYICSSKKQDYCSQHVHLHLVRSIFQRLFCLYLFSFSSVALSSFLRRCL